MDSIPPENVFLLDLEGRRVSLQEFAGRPLLIIFLRHLAWLPCQEHLREVQAVKNRFDERDVRIVVVSFAEQDRLKSYQQAHKWPFVMLADPERKGYGYFGLQRLPWHRVFSLSTLKLYVHLLLKGRKLENYGRDDFYQSGGDVLLDRTGKIVFAHRSHDPADRPSVRRLLEEVERLQ